MEERAPTGETRAPGGGRLALAALLTLPVVAIATSGLEIAGDARWSRYLQALLATPVVFGLGAEFHRNAARRLGHASANRDSLISLGTLAAYGASLYGLLRGGPLYFETAAVITTLVLLGRYLEARARGRACQAITRLAALRVGGDTWLASLLRRVGDIQTDKPPVQRLADSLATWFIPAVLLVAATTAIGWLLLGAEPATALTHAVAVLVVACPSALGLAAPAAIAAASGRGAELGIFFKGARVFERSHKIDVALFCKTGTLTRGKLRLERLLGCESDAQERRLLALAASLEAPSEHAIARAIQRAAEERGVTPPGAKHFEAIPGRGARGRVAGEPVHIGAPDWIESLGPMLRGALRGQIRDAESQGETVVLCAVGDEILGGFALADTLRPHAREAIEPIRRLGIEVELVTGDNERAARSIASQLGIDAVLAGTLPADKVTAIRLHQARGRRVAFIGDRLDDAPALGQADLGMALGSGTDVVIESGDVILSGEDPRLAARALALARRTDRVIRQNLFWAFVYNGAAIPLAVMGALEPMLAAGAMALSSLSVVQNSLRLQR